jgi:uncharacterized protein
MLQTDFHRFPVFGFSFPFDSPPPFSPVIPAEAGIQVERGSLSVAFFRLTLHHAGGRLRQMNIGVAKVSLRIPENMDLKGKRQVLKSIIGRVKGRFEVAVAEVDANDMWQLATIGICCISNNKRHSNEVLSKVVDFISNGRFDAEILDYSIEMIEV